MFLTQGEFLEAEVTAARRPGRPFICWYCGQGYIIAAGETICPECSSVTAADDTLRETLHRRLHQNAASPCPRDWRPGILGRQCPEWTAAKAAVPETGIRMAYQSIGILVSD